MSAVEDILQNVDIDQLAAQLGVDPATAEEGVRQAVPALLGGMQANAQDPAGAASLAGALGDHSPDLVEGGVDLDQVDVHDGEKIVSNIFGGSQDQVAQTLGGNLGGNQSLVRRLLPLLAPIVLSYLAKHVQGGKYGNILGPILAGAGGGGSGSNPLTDLLGSLLGGGRSASFEDDQQGGSANSILDMLGGLLGGGRR